MSLSTTTIRPATVADAPALAQIYNQGIEDRNSTFETRLRSREDVLAWLSGRFPVMVAVRDCQVIAFARSSVYRGRECYAGIAEFSVYVERGQRGSGAGRAVLEGLIVAAREAGFWKLLSRVFPNNLASRALLARCGFREVGRYERHGQLEGVWKDVLIIERLL